MIIIILRCWSTLFYFAEVLPCCSGKGWRWLNGLNGKCPKLLFASAANDSRGSSIYANNSVHQYFDWGLESPLDSVVAQIHPTIHLCARIWCPMQYEGGWGSICSKSPSHSMGLEPLLLLSSRERVGLAAAAALLSTRPAQLELRPPPASHTSPSSPQT